MMTFTSAALLKGSESSRPAKKFLDFLDADLELRQTEINLMKQNGQLGDWLHGAVAPPGTTPPSQGPGSVLPAAPTAPR